MIVGSVSVFNDGPQLAMLQVGTDNKEVRNQSRWSSRGRGGRPMKHGRHGTETIPNYSRVCQLAVGMGLEGIRGRLTDHDVSEIWRQCYLMLLLRALHS